MSESATKHIARLDFDISTAESQLKNIQAQIAGLTNFINSQNWDLSTLMNVNSAVSQTTPLQNAVQQINVLTAAQAALQKQINSLMSQRKDAANQQLSTESQIADALNTIRSAYNTLSAAGTKMNSDEAERANRLKSQLEYIEKQYQANRQLTATQKAHLEAAQKTAKALKESAERTKEETEASQKGKKAEEDKYNALRKLATAQKSLNGLQENINKLSGEEKSKREQALSAMQNEYSALKQAFDTNGSLTAEQQKQLNLLKSKIDAENQMVKLLNTEQGTQSAITSSNSTLLSKMQSTLVSAGKQAVSGGLDEMKTAENAMMEIQRIINSTDAETAKMRQNLLDLGNEYGRNFEEVADIALRFTQAGYQMEETLSMTADALLGMNTAEMDSEEATIDLIAILKQWGYESDDLITVIDKLNYTADTNATTTQDLIEALQKVGSTAKAANLSFDETVGYLTAMKEASGAAGKEVGNAFKSILSYIQRDKALDAFDSIGIDVWADKSTGELNAMGDILKQMADKWNGSSEEMKSAFMDAADSAGFMNEELAADLQLTDTYNEYMENVASSTDKANDAESRLQANMAAGTYRRNYYIGLMQNFNDALKVTSDLQYSVGHSEEQNGLYMETLTAKTEQLSAALTELAVYAGDAGLLDLAKGAIEAATACTKFLKNQKALLSTLTLVAGIIATLKAQKIAEEITAIGKSAAGVATNISNVVNVIKGVEITAETASGAVTKLSAAMGAIGLAVTAITLVITAVKAYKQAVEEARQATVEDAEEEQKKADTLTDIKKRYEDLSERAEELRNNHKKTAEEEQELADITAELNTMQEKLSESYGVQAANIDLVNGKRDEELNKLNQLEEAELNLLKAKQEAALAVLTEDAESSTAITTEKHAVNNKTGKDLSAIAEEASGGYVDVKESWGSVQVSTDATKESLQDLKNAIQAVEDAGGKYSGVWTALTEAMVSSEEQIRKVDDAEKALAETDMALYIKETGNAIEDLTLNNFEDWKQGLINVEAENQNVRNSLEALAEEQREVAKQNTFKELFTDDNGNLTQAYNDLLKLAEQGKLTADNLSVFFDTSETGFADFRQQIYDSGLSLNDVALMFQNLATIGTATTDMLSGTAGSIEVTAEEVEAFAEAADNAESSISELNKYMQTLQQGNYLTAEEVKKLCDTYGLLPSQFEKTESGYTVEIELLEKLKNAQVETAAESKLSAEGYTEAVINELTRRINAYGIEIDSIKSLAEAEAGLAKVRLQLNTITAAANVNSREDVERFQEQNAELIDMVDNLEDYVKALNKVESNNTLYDDLGKTANKTTASSDYKDNIDEKEAKQKLKDLDYYHNMGLIKDEEYYNRKLALAKQYYKADSESLRAVEVEKHKFDSSNSYKSGVDTEQAEKDFSALEKLRKNDEISTKEYYDRQIELAKEYYKADSDAFKDIAEAKADWEKEMSKQGYKFEVISDDSMSKIKSATKELDDFNKKMQSEYGLGNVDLTKRPKVDMDDGSTATVLSSYDFVWQGDEENGKYVAVHYTPILPDGTVLDDKTLKDYIYGSLEGAENILNADSKGIVLKVDTDLNITDKDVKSLETGDLTPHIKEVMKACDDWDVSLHNVQEEWVELDNKLAETTKNASFVIADPKDIDEQLDSLDKAYGDGIINAGKYIDELTVMRDTYFTENSDKWNEYSEKIKNAQNDAFNGVLSAFDGLVDKGAYSVDEQIAFLEDLRDNFDLTAEQAEILQEKLVELYSTKVTDWLDSIKDYYDQAIDDLDEYYDKLKDAENDNYDKAKENENDLYDQRKSAIEKEYSAREKELEASYKKQTEQIKKASKASTDAIKKEKEARLKAVEDEYDAQIAALEAVKEARNRSRDTEDYNDQRKELLEELSYWEQRTGTDAVENVESIKKKIADLDKDRRRDLEDQALDDRINGLKDEKDKKTTTIEDQYAAQEELIQQMADMQEEMAERQLELLQAQNEAQKEALSEQKEAALENLETQHDAALDNLEKEHETALDNIESEREAAVAEKQAELDEILAYFDEYNQALLANSAEVAPEIFAQFEEYFTTPMENSIETLRNLMKKLSTDVKGTLRSINSISTSGLTVKSGTGKSGTNKSSSLVGLATGGYVKSEGIALLHPNEVVVNSDITNGLKAIVNPNLLAEMQNTLKNAAQIIRNTNINNTYNNAGGVTQNININSPLQNIETVENGADLDSAVNKMEKSLMRKISQAI